MATAFAKAKAKGIVLVVRNAEQLANTEQDVRRINNEAKVLSVSADIADEASVQALFEKVKAEFGTADVLVNNAGILTWGQIDAVTPKAWWGDFVCHSYSARISPSPYPSASTTRHLFPSGSLSAVPKIGHMNADIFHPLSQEVNVKGTFLVTKAFLALVGRDKPAAVINITSSGAVNVFPGMSGYGISKLALVQLQQYVAAEYPNVTAIAASPGTVATDQIVEALARFAKDTPELVGGATVWLATDKAKFLNGRYVSVNWSFDELLQRKDEIVGDKKLLTGLNVKLGKDQFE